MDPSTVLLMYIHNTQDKRGLKWNQDMEGDIIAIINEMKDKIRDEVVHEVEKLFMQIMESNSNEKEILPCSCCSKEFIENIYTH